MSKYRSKQNQKRVVKKFQQPDIVFNYACECHGERASKKPCAKGNGEPDDKGFFQSPLGTWTCPITRRACKVVRTRKVKNEEPQTESAADVVHRETRDNGLSASIEEVHASL